MVVKKKNLTKVEDDCLEILTHNIFFHNEN